MSFAQGGGNAVRSLSAQGDINSRPVQPFGRTDQRQRVIGGRGGADHHGAQRLQRLAQVLGDQEFVFDHKDMAPV